MKEVKKGGVKSPLCIVGTATSCAEAPYGDETVEIWAIDTAIVKEEVKRVDRLFEMHPKRYWGQPAVLERLCNFDGPVYMQDHYEDIPNSVSYPYEEVKNRFYIPAMGDNLYVTNTITWMILLALQEGYTDISLYGVHMAHQTEYAYQRASCSWALGIIHGWILEGKPYKLYIHDHSSLLRAEYEYGYAEPTKAMQYLQGRIDGMKRGVADAQGQINTLEQRKLRTEGAMSEARHIYEKLAGWK